MRMPTSLPNHFQTLNDPVLEGMLAASVRFLNDIWEQRRAHWLSFCGSSGTGKTFLAKMIQAELPAGLHYHSSLKDGVAFYCWPDVLTKLRNKAYYIEEDFRDATFAVLDDIGADRDPTGFAADSLYRMLNGREQKWTVITSNLTMEKLAEVDTRIVSRLVRHFNVCVKCDTLDFSLRPKP